MNDLRESLNDAKQRLPLPVLLSQLGLGEHACRTARCPFHEDRSPSFSIWESEQGWQWKCHAGCGGGDEISFLEIHLGTSNPEAIRTFREMARVQAAPLSPQRWEKSQRPKCGLILPNDASPGTEADWRELANMRGLNWTTTAKASELGTLLFGTVFGLPSWILTDERRLCAEARRMDGEPFPAIGDLGKRKAHTIKGSVKSWPVGLSLREFTITDFRAVLIVEGGPDYLTAWDWTLRDAVDCLPVAFLGAGTASAIHPGALDLMKGCRVRFYPHDDPNGAGLAAVEKWATQLRAIGATITAFSFTGLRKTDGSPVKDLNDCMFIHPADANQLEGLLP